MLVATQGQTSDLWSQTFSHEVMETLADPTTAGREVCDPVEDESYQADNGVMLQAFAKPAYFTGDHSAVYSG